MRLIPIIAIAFFIHLGVPAAIAEPAGAHPNREHQMNVNTIMRAISLKYSQSSGATLVPVDEDNGHISVKAVDMGSRFNNDIVLVDTAVAINRMNNQAIKDGKYMLARWMDVVVLVGATKYRFDKPLFVEFKSGQINDALFVKKARKLGKK